MVVNLASNEYYHAIQPKLIEGDVIDVDFKEHKDGQFKTIGIHAKRARGMMARHIVCHRLTEVGQLTSFAEAGYRYNPDISTSTKLVFTR